MFDITAEEFRRDQLLTGMSRRYVSEVAITVRSMARAIGPPETVTEPMLKDYVVELLTTPARDKRSIRRPNTVARIVHELRCYFRWMKSTGRISQDPTLNIPTPKHHDRMVAPLEPHELAAFLEAAKDGHTPELAARNYALAVLAYDTALRLSELLSLDREDAAGETITVFGKGARHRTIPLNVAARAALENYLELRIDDSPALFINIYRGRMKNGAAQSLLKRIRKRLKFKSELTWHNIRRTSLTDLASSGMMCEARKVIAGHSTDRAAQRYTAYAGLRGAINEHRKHSPADRLLVPVNGAP